MLACDVRYGVESLDGEYLGVWSGEGEVGSADADGSAELKDGIGFHLGGEACEEASVFFTCRGLTGDVGHGALARRADDGPYAANDYGCFVGEERVAVESCGFSDVLVVVSSRDDVAHDMVYEGAVDTVSAPETSVEEMVEPHVGFVGGAVGRSSASCGYGVVAHLSFFRPKGRKK